jgi:hypothetical protein
VNSIEVLSAGNDRGTADRSVRHVSGGDEVGVSTVDHSATLNVISHRWREAISESAEFGDVLDARRPSPTSSNAFVQQPCAAEVSHDECRAVGGHLIGEAGVHRVVRQDWLWKNTSGERPGPTGDDGSPITGVGDCSESAWMCRGPAHGRSVRRIRCRAESTVPTRGLPLKCMHPADRT